IWTKATDDVSSLSALQYEVRRSGSDNIGTVEAAEANGTVILPYTLDIAALNVTGLSPGTTYFFNVLVKDEAGNKAAYAFTSATTTGASSTLNLETAANGSGVAVGTQSVPSGSSITVFAIQRDIAGNFLANVQAAW